MVMYTRVPFGHILSKLGIRCIKSSRAVSFKRKLKESKIVQVQIDTNQFANGYDPNVKKEYFKDAYAILAKKPEAKEQLRKIAFGNIAKQVFNTWINTQPGKKAKNGRPAPRFRSVLTKVNLCSHSFGECLLGAANRTKSGFKCKFTSNKGSDGYIHHVAVLANSVSNAPIHTLSVIQRVSQKKNELNALSISHLCGNGGCCRPGHLLIERKTINEERTACHTFLRRCETKSDAACICRLCPHTPKCFVNVYKGIKDYY